MDTLNQNEIYSNEPKKKKGGIVIAIIAVIVVVIGGLAALVLLNLDAAKNLYRKTFMKPDEYCRAVLMDQNTEKTKVVGDLYEKYVINGFTSDEFSSETSLKLTVTDDAFEMVEDYSGADLEKLYFLSEVGITYSVEKNDGITSIFVNSHDGDGTIIDGQIMFDKDNEMVYIGFPEESDEFMAYELSTFYDDDEIEELFDVIDQIDEAKDLIPDRKTIESLYSKLSVALIETIDDVEKDEEVLEIGELSEKCTVLTVNVDEKMIKNMAKAFCDFLMDDELTDVIDSYVEEFADEDVYDEYTEEYESMLDELGDSIDDFEMPEDTEIKVAFYVGKKGKIIASKVTYEVEDETTSSFAGYIIKGKDIACEFSVENGQKRDKNGFTIKGNGTANGKVANIDFVAEANKEKVKFSLNDFEYTKLNQGYFIGTINFDFSQFKKEIPAEFKDMLLTININSESDDYIISLFDDDDLLVSLELIANNSDKSDLEEPEDVYEIEDETDIYAYMEDKDFDSLIDFLDELDIDYSDSYVEMAKDVMPEIIGSIPVQTFAFTELISPPQNIFVSGSITMTGILAPQLIKYISKSKVSSDMMLADTIRTAISTALCDPDIVNSDDYEDVMDELEDGVNIVEWGEPSNDFEEAVAEILGIDDFEDLEDMIKSRYSGDGIYVKYVDGGVYVEFQNTDMTGGSNLSGSNNISVGYMY